MAKGLMTINEITKQFGLPYSTVNHYTIIGLLTVVGKKRNIRLYNKAEVRARLERITCLKDKGYPLHLIRQSLG